MLNAETYKKNGCVHHVFFFGSWPLEKGQLGTVLRVLSLVVAIPALIFSVAIALVSAVVLVFIVQVLLLAARGKFRAWWAKIAVGKNTHPTGQDGQKTANRQNTLSPEIETAARPKGKQPASGSNKISSPPKRKRTNTSTSSGHRRSNSWPVAVAAASASAMGKPIQPIIFGVRDVIAQWFVRKEAEQQKEIEEHKYDKQRKQKRRTKQRSQPPPPENPESVENAELDVVWKPFMALMMNHGEERQGDAGGHVEMRRLQRHDGQTAAHRRSRDGGGGVDRPKAPPPPPPKHNHIHAANTDTAPPHPHPTIRLTTHILTLLSIGLFIVSIEATLSLASLSSINDISSIGQLIPFIIGLASFAASLRVLAIEMYRRRNPDWRDWAWEVSGTWRGFAARAVVRRDMDGQEERQGRGGGFGWWPWGRARARAGADVVGGNGCVGARRRAGGSRGSVRVVDGNGGSGSGDTWVTEEEWEACV